ncbi:MAG: trimethylamine methyltransferase family protein [Candidatus Bathyarchaeota archaeon]|nr:MAG: trimethylamine methyltransferase family protein [Candidatus Bathyarchaeota archaeon]
MGKMKLEILSKNDCERIHNASIKVLETIGAQFLNDEALNYLEKYGSVVDRKQMIAKIPERVVNEFMKKAKPEWPYVNRDFKPIPKQDVYFMTFGEGTYMTDRNGVAHPSQSKDQEKVLIVGNALPAVDIPHGAVTARDIPPWRSNFAGIVRDWNLLSNPKKSAAGFGPIAGVDDESMAVAIELCSILAGGKEKLLKNPILTGGGCPTSPLVWPKIILDLFIQAAKNGMRTLAINMAVSASTAPMSLAGTLVIHCSEMLSFEVFSQLVAYDAGYNGIPAMMGCSATTMDVRKGYCPVGNPEMALLNAAAAELAQYYNCPNVSAGA